MPPCSMLLSAKPPCCKACFGSCRQNCPLLGTLRCHASSWYCICFVTPFWHTVNMHRQGDVPVGAMGNSCRALLPKEAVLTAGLFRSAGVKKLADFLARDFRQAASRAAAAKNAFVLLGQHRYELAAVFFILGAVRCQLAKP